jgi:hypothetical protein
LYKLYPHVHDAAVVLNVEGLLKRVPYHRKRLHAMPSQKKKPTAESQFPMTLEAYTLYTNLSRQTSASQLKDCRFCLLDRQCNHNNARYFEQGERHRIEEERRCAE